MDTNSSIDFAKMSISSEYRILVSRGIPGAPPSADALAAKAEGLKKAETKVAAGVEVDPAVVAVYKKSFADNGDDKGKVCKALGLEESKWVDGGEAALLSKYFGVK